MNIPKCPACGAPMVKIDGKFNWWQCPVCGVAQCVKEGKRCVK